MPQVPYQPAPTERPIAGTGASPFNLNVSAASFGGAVAAATEHLGQTVEHASDEMFVRAQALQQLKNETEASEADSKYMIAVGEKHAQFSSLQGKAAVDAYPGYIKDLEKTRQGVRDGLSNDMARKMFDRSSLSTMGRTIFNGAGHAATEQKQWAIGTANSQLDLDAKTVEDNPKDERLFQDKRNRIISAAKQISTLKGFEEGGPEERDLVLKATSKARAQQLLGLGRVAPFEAAEKLDKYKKELTQDDYLRVDNSVRAQGRAVGSVNIANGVYAGGRGDDTHPAKSLGDMEAEVKAKAEKQSPDDPLLAQHAVAALRGIYNQDKYARKQENWEYTQDIDGAIQRGVSDIQQLRADPKIAAAIDALPESERMAIPARINNYNAARDKPLNEDTYKRIRGTANNDVEQFLNTDISSQRLSQSQMKELMGLQEKIKKQQGQDPRVDRAVNIIRGAFQRQMEALGIYRRTQNNKDDYDHFTGTVQQAIDVWQESHGKPPSGKEIQDVIAPQVLKQRTEPADWFGWAGSTQQKSFFQQEVPEKWADDWKKYLANKGEPEPDKEQLQKDYVRHLFIDLYGAKGSKVPKKDQGQVK